MKRIGIVVFLALFLSTSLCIGAEDTPYTIVEDPWPPYTYGKAGSAPQRGLAVELMQTLFERLHVPIRLELLPWKRCIMLARSGQVDALMLTVKTSRRQEFFYFTEPFFSNSIVFLYRRGDSFSWDSFKDLKKYRLGLVRGSDYSQEFTDAIARENLDVQRVETIRQNLDKLLVNRIDATPVLDVVAGELIKMNPRFQDKFSFAAKPLKTTEMHMALSRKSKIMNIADQIDATIREMKKDGTVEAIMATMFSYQNNWNIYHNHHTAQLSRQPDRSPHELPRFYGPGKGVFISVLDVHAHGNPAGQASHFDLHTGQLIH